MIATVDLFYIVASICLLGLLGFVGYAVIQITQTLKVARLVLNDLYDTTSDINALKNGIKLGTVNILRKLISKGRR